MAASAPAPVPAVERSEVPDAPCLVRLTSIAPEEGGGSCGAGTLLAFPSVLGTVERFGTWLRVLGAPRDWSSWGVRHGYVATGDAACLAPRDLATQARGYADALVVATRDAAPPARRAAIAASFGCLRRVRGGARPGRRVRLVSKCGRFVARD